MKYFLAAILCVVFSQSSRAYYYHNPTGEMIDPHKFNEKEGTATYFDHSEGKKKTVKISDLSKETFESLNGVKSGKLVLLNKADHNFCETFHVFENGIAYIGCQTNKIQQNIGANRPRNLNYYAPVEFLTGEIEAKDGFRKKDKVVIRRDSGKISAGALVRIEAIFPDGTALIQKMGANLLDTSSLRLKLNIEHVSLLDLEMNASK